MRISSEWLSEYVAVPSPERLEEVLLMAGLVVEEREGDRFELEVTSNRGDWLSAIGIAREIGALTESRFRLPSPDVDEDGPSIEGRVQVEIENAFDCPRYVGRLIENVTVGPSPDWMQARLIACGVRPINNVVDVTNYVMLEWGQPLHAFDFDSVPGNRIVVRRARAGEKLTTLDGVERALSPELLVIADSENPIGVAGVMGGQNSEVTTETRCILLESAHFAPSLVRRGAHLLTLGTDASRRFERWVDPNGCRRAADRAAQLIAQLGGGQVAYGAVDRYVMPVTDAIISIRPARCSAVLGLKLSSGTIQNCLERLGFRVTPGDGSLRVSVPTFRRDLEREIDLIEEVARVYGYDRIPTTLHEGANPAAGRPLAARLEDRARSAMLRCGLTEVTTYSLSNEAAHNRVGESAANAVRLRNPLSEDYTLLRTSLLPSLLDVLKRNSRRRLRAFEIGKLYHAKSYGELPHEQRVLGIALSAANPAPHWQSESAPVDFYALKAVLESVLKEFGAPVPALSPTRHPAFHPGRCASVSLDGEDVGVLGEIHPTVAASYDLEARAYIASIDFDALVRHITLLKQYEPLGRFPSADRDIALVVPETTPAGAITDAIIRAGGAILESARVFDVYQGANLPEATKSLAIAMRFRVPDRTLTEPEVESAMASIREATERVGGRLR